MSEVERFLQRLRLRRRPPIHVKIGSVEGQLTTPRRLRKKGRRVS